MKIVIVGHIDHGKSTLIGRLLYDTNSLQKGSLKELKEASEALGKELEFGFVMDHLEEEREQGITIDTAQKFFSTNKRDYTIIDAPGHVEFIRNMITGASQAEAGLLIVDAEEGVEEQTRRHAYILSMLGIKKIIVVINKMDLVEWGKERFNEVKKDLEEFLNKIYIKADFIIPVSAKKGDNIAKKSGNMEWYNGETVLNALDSFTLDKQEGKKLRFAVQDVYNFDERIIAGKIISGEIKKDQGIVVLPSKESTKIKRIKLFKNELEKAKAGQNIGIIPEDKLFIERGNIITGKNLPKIANNIKANIFWLDKIKGNKNENFLFKCSTQEVDCRISEIKKKIDSSSLKEINENKDEIHNREVGKVIIETEKPVIIENFNNTPELGRFVLERKDTVAGGIITNQK